MTEPAGAPPSWHAMQVRARIRFLANLGSAPLADVDEAEGVTTVITGGFDNTLNGVFRARLDPSRADRVIAATLARFQERHAPAIWWLDLGSTPGDLPARLEAAGCRPERTGIVRGGLVADLHRRAGERLARAGDRSVGMCSAFYAEADQIVLIDHLDVAEAVRRRGIATALLHAALGEARRRDCRWAVLEPTPESATFYDAVGFEGEACRPGVEFYLPLEPPAHAGV